MKAMLVALALVALAVSATATHTCGQQAPPPLHQCSCQQPPLQQPPMAILTQCSELLRQQCSPVPTPYCTPQCQSLRQQCCQQIRQVEPMHQYHAVYTTVLQTIMQQPQTSYGGYYGYQGQVGLAATQIAQQLTAMCGLHQGTPY